MRDGRGELDHVIGLRDVVEALRVDHDPARATVGHRFDKQRLQGVGAQVVEDLGDAESQHRLVFQRLDRPLGGRLPKRRDGRLIEGQCQQPR